MRAIVNYSFKFKTSLLLGWYKVRPFLVPYVFILNLEKGLVIIWKYFTIRSCFSLGMLYQSGYNYNNDFQKLPALKIYLIFLYLEFSLPFPNPKNYQPILEAKDTVTGIEWKIGRDYYIFK